MRWGQFRLRGVVHLISRLPATDSPHRGSLWRFRKSCKRLICSANQRLRYSIFFCFSKRKRWRVRNDHDGTNPCKQGFLSSVLISSFPNRKLNLRFGGDFDFLSDSLELTKKTSSVFLDLSRDSLKSNANPYCPIFYLQDILPQLFKRNDLQIRCPISGGA